MRGWLRTCTVVLVAVGTAVIGGWVAQASSVPPCGPGGARTVIQTPDARVFTQPGSASDPGARDRIRVTWHFGCLRGRKRLTRLGWNGEYTGGTRTVGAYALRGRFVAYGDFYGRDPDGGAAYVRLVDLAAGKRVRSRWATQSRDTDPGITTIVVTSRGGFAWIAGDYAAGVPPYEVHRVGAGGNHRLLDSGRVRPNSLHLAGSRIAWIKNGVRRSASAE